MHPSPRITRAARRNFTALLCAVALLTAGCHSRNPSSGAGIAWVTLTDSPGDFTSYIVNVNSITLTRSDGVSPITALAAVETVDFSKLNNVAELWGTATIPLGTYLSATIELDYTNANISVMVNGLPVKANVVDSAGNQVKLQTIHVLLDPANPLVVPATFATTSAQRLAVDFNLAASTSSINLTTPIPTVTIKPFLTAGLAAPDNKLIRVRGPLINSSVALDTYTVYVRPFFDAANSLGSLTIFADANTVYTVNGVAAVGSDGLLKLSQSSAGSTITAAYTTYEPTATPSVTAGKYHAKYVVAGSTLEDIYTYGLEGDVVARVGNTLTVRGPRLQLNNNTSSYSVSDAFVTVGPNTSVTVDNQAMQTPLDYRSVAVGQHIVARGVYNMPTATLDATGGPAGTASNNTGSLRLLSTSLYGSLVSSSTGNLLLNVQTINNWPITDFAFAGNGATAASDPTGANFLVNTGGIVLPDATVGHSLWIDGLVTPFGTAPPDFNASVVNAEGSVPASMRVYWTAPGTGAPFSVLSASAMSVNLTSPNFHSGVIRIGPASIDMTTLAASPQIVPQTGTAVAGLPATFTPLFAYGNPAAVAPEGIHTFSVFPTFATDLTAALALTPALQFEARGLYNQTTNIFSASSINVVL